MIADEAPCELAWVEDQPFGFLPPARRAPAHRGRMREDPTTLGRSSRSRPGMAREDSASSEGSPRDKVASSSMQTLSSRQMVTRRAGLGVHLEDSSAPCYSSSE